MEDNSQHEATDQKVKKHPRGFVDPETGEVYNLHNLNPIQQQRVRLLKLLKNPEKPVHIPEPKKRSESYVNEPPEIIKTYTGSSAGAGSGDFHLYRNLRRKELARQSHMEREAKKEQKILDFEEKKRKIEEVEENKRKKRKEQRQRRRNNGDKKKVNLEKLAEPETSNQFKMVPNTFALSEQGDDLNIKSQISDSDAEPLVSSTHNKDTNPLHGTNISSDENSAKTSSRHRTFTNIIDE